MWGTLPFALEFPIDERRLNDQGMLYRVGAYLEDHTYRGYQEASLTFLDENLDLEREENRT